MNKTQQLRELLSSLDALLTVTVKQADRHGLSEIRISTARARELQREITIAKKAFELPIRSQQSLDAHLDAITNFSSVQR
jgi:hypothetical protein